MFVVIVLAIIAITLAIAINQWYGSTESFDASSERYNSLAATQTVNSLNRIIPVTDPTGSTTNSSLQAAMNTPLLIPGSDTVTNTSVTVVPTTAAVPGRNAVAAQAAICEKQSGVGTCAMLDDPAFGGICGVCIKGGTRSTDIKTGEWVGGLYMDADDRQNAKVLKSDPQPTAGACPPGYFFLDRASCEKGVNRLQCSEAGLAGGWSGPSAPIVDAKCAEATPGGKFVYDTKKRSFLVKLRLIVPSGTGRNIFTLFRVQSDGSRGKQIGFMESNQVKEVFLVSTEPVVEGDKVELNVVQEFATHTKGEPEVYAVGRPGYTFTQNTAAFMCKSLGAQLATAAQVEEAQGAGANWCASGHVQNGPPQYPMQVAEDGCGSKGINVFGSTSDFRVANCYGIKPSINDDYSATDTKVYAFADKPSKRDSRFGRIQRGVRAIIAQWENTYDDANSHKTAIPFEGTLSSETKRMGSFSSSGLIASPRAKDFPNYLSNQYWLWSGTGQTAIFRSTVPATFLPPVYDEDAVLTVGKPLLSLRSSIPQPKASVCGTPPYSPACLLSLFTAAGGDGVRGKLSPTVGGADAIQELQKGSQDAVSEYVNNLYGVATTGRNTNGTLATRKEVNAAAMKLFGFEIASPCEEIIAGADGSVGLLPKEAPISPECMDHLYRNAGKEGFEGSNVQSPIPATYVSIGDRYSGIKKGEYGVTKRQLASTPFRTCTPNGTVAPIKGGKVDPSAIQKISSSTDGSIEGIQGFFNRIFQLANADGSQDTLAACFGINRAPPVTTVTFQSKNFPSRSITSKGLDQQVRLEEGISAISIRPGIIRGTVSLGPFAQPNQVFRHSGFVLYNHTIDNSDLQKQDSSFYMVKGLSDPAGISFKSYNYPDRYLRHSNFGFFLDSNTGGPYADDATFYRNEVPSTIPSSFRPSQGTLLAIIQSSVNYRISFNITPNKIIGTYNSILRITTTGGDCCAPGDRVPGFWFTPNSLGLHVRVGDSTNGNWGFESVPGCSIGKTSYIILECINSTIKLSIDGVISTLTQPTSRPSGGKALVYGGDPYWSSANAIIQNLVYQSL